MKILRRILFVLIILVAISLVSGLVFVHYLAHKGVPEYVGEVVLPGMKEPVTVYRDSLAIPHIYAMNEEDLYRAVGYVMAQDRLWQMDLIRRVTTGRLSEIFGEDFVETDLFLRALRIPEKSKMVLNDTSPEMTVLLEAYAEGVNRFIEQHIHTLPIEFSVLGYNPEPWKPEHSMNIIGYMAWDLAGNVYACEVTIHKLKQKFGTEKLSQLIPDIESTESIAYPDFKWDSLYPEIHSGLLRHSRPLVDLGVEILQGSNNWAISGDKSITGKPIFANDMHLGFGIPGIWYQMHHIIEGELNVTGIGIPGEPLIVAGHNDSIAWGMTNLAVDDIDLYLEEVNPENSLEYRLNGEWKKMEVRQERIKIKGGDTLLRELRFTHRGPIISEFNNLPEAISMRWGGNDYSNEFRSVYLLNRACNWEDFKEAIRTFKAISQNFAYADVNGNIGMYAAGGIPVRNGNGFYIFPGNTDEYDWKGKVPFEELPHSFNPSSGLVVSANNKSVSSDYPYYIGIYFSPPYRFERITELLNEQERLGIDDFKKVQMDQQSGFAERIIQDVIPVLDKMENPGKNEKAALEILKSWNFIMDKESSAATIYITLYHTIIENILRDEMGPELFDEYSKNATLARAFFENIWNDRSLDWFDDITTEDEVEAFDGIIETSFKEAIKILTNEYGVNPYEWRWGDLHTLTLKHPLGTVGILNLLFRLNRGPFPVGGSSFTVNSTIYFYSSPYVVSWGVSQRHIYPAGEWDRSLSVIPTGTCGVPASDFYCDQTNMYLEGIYHPDYFSRDKVVENARFTMIISPQ